MAGVPKIDPEHLQLDPDSVKRYSFATTEDAFYNAKTENLSYSRIDWYVPFRHFSKNSVAALARNAGAEAEL